MLNEGVTDQVFEYGIAHYAYVLAVTIPFDIRDLKYDSKSQKTIPQVMGVNASKVLSIALLFACMSLLFALVPALKENYLFYLAVGIQMLLVGFMSESRSDLYCAGYIDGSIALLGLSYLLV